MKLISKFYFVVLLLLCNIIVSNSMKVETNKKDTVNLFEYGTVITNEDNLRNLFKNFPVLIENGDAIDFISYKYIGTIKSKKHAKKYTKKNFEDLIPIAWITSFPSSINGESVGSASIRLVEGQIPETKSQLKKHSKTIAELYINAGDEVFVIDYVYNLTRHTHYVFINPDTKKVLLEGNIFGIEIPIECLNHED